MEVQKLSIHLSDPGGLPFHFSQIFWRTREKWIEALIVLLIFSFSLVLLSINLIKINHQVLVSSVRILPTLAFVLKPEYKPATDSSADPWRRDCVVKDQSPINPSHSVPVTQLIGAGAASARRETLADCWSMVHGIGSHLRRRT